MHFVNICNLKGSIMLLFQVSGLMVGLGLVAII